MDKELEERLKAIEEQLSHHPTPPDPQAPRHRAAILLARFFAASFLLLVATEMASTVRSGIQTGDALATLMLTIGSLLVGITSSYLSRNLNRPPTERVELESRVGIILVITLGGMLLIMSLADLYELIIDSPTVGLSNNALNVFAVLLSGIVGALGGYLGFRNERPPTSIKLDDTIKRDNT